MAVWFPEGSRHLDGVRFDDGRAIGLQAHVRREGVRLSGWVGYSLGVVELDDQATGRAYHPPWDRRHAIDAALFALGPWGTEISARATFGTGTPFWPFAGYQILARLTPVGGQLWWGIEDRVPYWSAEPLRMPQHFRADLGLRRPFELWRAEVEPFVSVLNATARPNVLYYEARITNIQLPGQGIDLVPVPASEMNIIPSFGINVRF